MAKKSSMIAVIPEAAVEEEQTVDIMLPELPGSGSPGIKVDQYEHVTLANEDGETCYKVHRGEYVPVPVSVFMRLKDRYPKI